jgi:dihydroneopterin aldolase
MDRVFIEELRVDTRVGILPWERVVRQTVCLELEMAWDNRPAAASGEISDALDYAAVAARVAALVAGRQWDLIETLAEEVAASVMADFGVPWLRLSVRKPAAVAAARAVGVTIERGEPPR